jgi:hypothetical protein
MTAPPNKSVSLQQRSGRERRRLRTKKTAALLDANTAEVALVTGSCPGDKRGHLCDGSNVDGSSVEIISFKSLTRFLTIFAWHMGPVTTT